MAKAKTTKAIDLKAYQGIADSLQNKLRESKTAYTPNTDPTLSDLRAQLSLMNTQKSLDIAKNNALKLDLYGPTGEASSNVPKKESFIGRSLHALGTPLYAIVGGVEAVLGKGTKKGLSNIGTNIKEHGTFGDLFRSYNVNKWAALPLGLALDIALDPVNWITAGTSATIPKLAYGFKEAGITGLKAAGKSASLGTADLIASKIPLLSKFVPVATKTNLTNKASAAEDIFRSVVGKPSVIEEIATKSNEPKLGEKVLKFAEEHNIPGVETFNKKFKYSAGEKYAETIKEDIQHAQQFASGERGTLHDAIWDVTTPEDALTSELIYNQSRRESNYFKAIANETASNPPSRGVLTNYDSGLVQNKMKETIQETEDLARIGAAEVRSNLDETGIKWFDNLRQKANESPTAKKIWDAYDWMNGLFKFTKVSVNPTSYTNAIIGNTTMAGMMGYNIADSSYQRMLRQTLRLLNGNIVDKKLTDQIMHNAELRSFVENYEKTAGLLGLNKGVLDRAATMSSLEQFGKEAVSISNKAELGNLYSKDSPETISLIQRLSNFFNTNNFRRTGTTGLGINQGDLDTSILHDVFSGPFGQTVQEWRDLPEGPRKYIAEKAAQASAAYQKIDHTFKIGTLLHTTLNGVTEGELRRLSQFVKLDSKDITRVGNLYRISPIKAGEIANEAFMNYAAMPDAVKFMRSLPLLGGPFSSFTYAMVTKTGKTLINNPSLFNKVTFTRDEIGRTSPVTPLEKKALSGPYYSYLNTYERMKIPFFQSFPTYLNIANWLPYLGLNTFQPSERKYSTAFGESVGSIVDKLPFLKTPEGQVLFDYVIQPWVLNETQPTGMFGQPLYHASDTGIDKSGRAIEALAQAYVPPWFPPGYRFKQVTRALQGKSAQGVQSTKSGYDLTAKAILSTLGLPLSDINLSQQASTLKKELTPTKKK